LKKRLVLRDSYLFTSERKRAERKDKGAHCPHLDAGLKGIGLARLLFIPFHLPRPQTFISPLSPNIWGRDNEGERKKEIER